MNRRQAASHAGFVHGFEHLSSTNAWSCTIGRSSVRRANSDPPGKATVTRPRENVQPGKYGGRAWTDPGHDIGLRSCLAKG